MHHLPEVLHPLARYLFQYSPDYQSVILIVLWFQIGRSVNYLDSVIVLDGTVLEGFGFPVRFVPLES